jgi:nucleotide-binding universal stress UspA family protein
MKILVALDSSSYASEILKNITQRAWSKDTQFRVITVVRPTGNYESDLELGHQAKTILDDRVTRMRDRLADIADIDSEIFTGDARATIVQEAKSWKADLIVLGSHGDTGVRPETIGSVASGVVHDAPCSVEVVKLATADQLQTA